MLTGNRIICTLGGFCLSALLLHAQDMLPGTVNYTEGEVLLRGALVDREGAGMYVMGEDQTLETKAGRAEVLLTPGIFVRVGEDSLIRMAEITGTELKLNLERGQAIIEVDQADKSRPVDISAQGVEARLDKKGTYGFDTVHSSVMVFSGKLAVEEDRRGVRVDQGEILRTDAPVWKPTNFDPSEVSELFRWTEKRADFASQVAEWTASSLLAFSEPSNFDRGWYWNPAFKSWAFLPAKGYIYTPYGYGLYAPQEPRHMTPIFGDFRTN